MRRVCCECGVTRWDPGRYEATGQHTGAAAGCGTSGGRQNGNPRVLRCASEVERSDLDRPLGPIAGCCGGRLRFRIHGAAGATRVAPGSRYGRDRDSDCRSGREAVGKLATVELVYCTIEGVPPAHISTVWQPHVQGAYVPDCMDPHRWLGKPWMCRRVETPETGFWEITPGNGHHVNLTNNGISAGSSPAGHAESERILSINSATYR